MPETSKPELEQQKVDLSRWFNEDTLVNQRLTWLLVSQALLFAAYGTVATKAMDACKEKAAYLFSILSVISVAGPILAAVVLVGIAAATTAQFILYKSGVPPTQRMGVSTPTTLVGWSTALLIPLIFIVAWLYVPEPRLADVLPSCSDASVGAPAGPTAVPVPPAATSTSVRKP